MDLDALLGLLFFVVFVVVPMITGARRRGQSGKGQQPGQPQRPQQAGQQQPGQAGQRQAQGQSLGGPSAQGSGGGLSGRQPGGAQQAAPNRPSDHPASSALEEIRRRVQEAQERERQREEERRQGRGASASTVGGQQRPARGLVTSDPFERGLVSGSAKKITGETMGREGMSRGAPISGSSGSIGREGQVSQPQLQRRRSGRAGGGLGREGSIGLGAMPSGKRSSLGREGRSPRGASLEAGEIGVGNAQLGVSPYGARVGRSSLVNVDRDGIVTGLIWHEILKEAPGKKRLRRTRSRPR